MKKEHFEVLLETMNDKIDAVLEGHTTLAEGIRHNGGLIEENRDLITQNRDLITQNRHRIDKNCDLIMTLNNKVDQIHEDLTKKIDTVAADLTTHRADTESHHKGWQVGEE